MKVARHVQSTQKGSFLQYIKKFTAAAFVFYFDAEHSDTFLGSSHVCCYLFLGGHGQKLARPLDHMELQNQVHVTYDLINQAD